MKAFKLIIGILIIFSNQINAQEITKSLIGSSYNMYSVLHPSTNAVHASDALGTVSFTHRQNAEFPGGSGVVQHSYSTDGGATWQYVLVSDSNQVNRYPSGLLVDPSGAGDIANAHAVVVGPSLIDDSWGGIYTNNVALDGSESRMNVVLDSVSYLPSGYTTRNSMMVDDNAVVRVCGRNNNEIDLVVTTGVYNVDSVGYFWTQQGFITEGLIELHDWSMAFSNDGNTGYLVAQGTDANGQIIPFVHMTTDAGATWTQMTQDYTAIEGYLSPGYNGGIDCAVDANGDLHMISSVIEMDEAVTETMRKLYDITTDGSTWSANYISDINTEEVLYYDAAAINGIGYNHRIQASKSADETKVFAIWTDVNIDVFAVELLEFPDVFVHGKDVNTNLSTGVKNFTEATEYEGANFWMFASPNAVTTDAGYSIPLTTSIAGDDELTAMEHYYVNGVEFVEEEFIYDPNLTYGCPDSLYVEYNMEADTINFEFCNELIIYGCTDSTYLEFHIQGFIADMDNGSCQTEIVYGCNNEEATNYASTANINDGTCYNLYPIEDPNFLAYLQDTYPECIINDSLNTLGTAGITEIDTNNDNIWSIDGLQYFSDLESLECKFNDISSLPVLPNSLKILDCSFNDLVSLPDLPNGLIELICSSNDITSLPELPGNLTYFDCGLNELISLPILPMGLTYLRCSNNNLISLPALPSSLTYLNCLDNELNNLPDLPNNLTYLNCDRNDLISLPSLPNTIESLNCANNSLTILPELPSNLTYLNCSNSTYTGENQIIMLPELPSQLTALYCSDISLASITDLPASLTTLSCQNNNLETLPVLPNSLLSLFCGNNNLTSLPSIPSNLSPGDFDFNGNPVQCVGNYPIYFEGVLGQYPHCINCTDSTAVNYVNGALYDDGSCQYNIAASFEVNISSVLNEVTISNDASLQINSSFAQDLEDGFLIGGFYTNEQGELVCAGYTTWNINGGNTITLSGDDPLTPQIEGLQEGESIIWIVQDTTTQENFYINVELINGEVGALFNANESLEIETFWLLEEGCTNVNSCNYNPAADIDDGSCFAEYLNCEGLCTNDTDEDGVCDEIEIVGCTLPMASNYNTDATDDDGTCIIWGCTDANASNYNSLATEDNTSCVFSSSYLGSVNGALDSLQNVYNSLSVDYDLSTNEADSMEIIISYQETQIQNYIWLTDSLSSPIQIDFVEGWNMIGYTLQIPQDAAATFMEIVNEIIIVKNNSADVYWPEFSFNGIGDLIPGHGYQMKIYSEINGFTFPNTNGQRMELSPTLPQWALDMEVEMHPNDIRTLVRVVNMLGQEVNPEYQPEGTTLLYLYNDGSVEKKINFKK